MTGLFVAVVGPSGVGKDSLIGFAKERLDATERVVFVRRVVTRQADGGSEDHDSMDVAEFEHAERSGAFALNWDAHGLRYGLPVGLEHDLAEGRVVVANLSRGVIPALLERYPDAVVVAVTAERDVIAARLANRGRETPETIARRLQRSVAAALPPAAITIDNSGDLSIGGSQFVRLLQDAAGLVERA